ncbi:glycosyltransferase family 2 protein [bacterium]|jgi:glycosyltransferase involved in cell wall biosynthesis|nr:glycosyltransferase family 2 protein [bacterium]
MKLTIGIPTYNRDEYLNLTLENIKESIGYYKGDWNIEVVIVDNSSIDKTEEIAKKFILQNKYLDIKYFKNILNIGFDRNVNKIMQCSSGDYVLLVSDDDLLENNCIKYLIKSIDNIKVTLGVIYINSFLMSSDGHNIDKNNELLFEIIGNNKLFNNGIDLIQTIKMQLYGGFTGITFNKKIWQENFSSKCFDTNYIQLCMAYRILSNNPVYVIYERLVKLRVANNTGRWASDGRLFLGLFKAFLPSKNLFPIKVYKLLYSDRLWEIRRSYLLYKLQKDNDQRKLKDYAINSLDKQRISFWLIDIILINLPVVPIFNKLYNLIKKIFKV